MSSISSFHFKSLLKIEKSEREKKRVTKVTQTIDSIVSLVAALQFFFSFLFSILWQAREKKRLFVTTKLAYINKTHEKCNLYCVLNENYDNDALKRSDRID